MKFNARKFNERMAAVQSTAVDYDTRRRAAVNQANAQHSTGPKTDAGKQRSSVNALKHGLYSSRIVQPHEDAEEYDLFRASLVAEHRPATPTEEFLVDELAQNAWKIRRLRAIEAGAFSSTNIGEALSGDLLTALSRALGTAERAFHRSLAALAKLQHARGFVPQKQKQAAQAAEAAAPPAGFVPPKPPSIAAEQPAATVASALLHPRQPS